MPEHTLKLIFTPVTDKNVELLRLLNTTLFPVRYNDDFYKKVYVNPKLAQFGQFNDTPVGAVAGRIEENKETKLLTQLYIMTLGVLEPYRRCGVGHQLLQYIIETVTTDPEFKELLTVVLHVQTSNEAALAFYKEHGFEITGRIDNYYQKLDPPDCHILTFAIDRTAIPEPEPEPADVAKAARETRASSMKDGDLGELIYFPVMAKGLQLAMCAEMSGLKWTGLTTAESGPNSWGEMKPSGVAPFGQLPLLKTPKGQNIGQSRAIANYIAKKAGPVLEGKSDKDFALSQMCLEEGEDIYAMLGKCQLGAFAPIEARNSKLEETKALFDPQNMEDGLAKHFKNLDLICRSDVNDDGKHSDCRFSSSGSTAGEIYLFGMIHQAVLAGAGPVLNKSVNARGGTVVPAFPRLLGWYNTVADMDGVKKVLEGKSAIGALSQYFLDTRAFNQKHGIEDDTGYGETNGYGTVAVDLAAEAKKAKDTMKALRASQMDKPPPVAMKLNKKTGQMEKFESAALADDFAEEEAADGEIELPCGDDY